MRILFFIIFFISNLFALINAIPNEMQKEKFQVLTSLDIDTSFIKDKKTKKLYKFYSKTRKKYFLNVLENGYSYIPLIKNEIKKADIPKNLVFVAMAESYFSSKAKSNKKAIGLWQFIPATARHFGLKIDDYVDERKDPIKSTIAAIKYLSYLKKKTGKWYLAIMAYNCGEARIIEAITRAKLDKYCEIHQCKNDKKIKEYRKIIKNYQYYNGSFASLYKVYRKVEKLYPKELSLAQLLKVQKKIKRQYLPKETRTYIRKIVAMNFLLFDNSFVAYNNHYLLNSGSTSNFVKVDVPAGTSLHQIAKLLNLDYNQLRRDNAHLIYGFTPPNKESYIYIPYNKLADFELNFNKNKIARKIIYKIKKGDSLASIAKKFGIHYKVIKDFNHLKSNLLHINQKLVIPIKPNLKIQKNIVYRVKKGESLRSIANKFHISYSKIKKINKLESDKIYINQKLTIPTYITLK